MVCNPVTHFQHLSCRTSLGYAFYADRNLHPSCLCSVLVMFKLIPTTRKCIYFNSFNGQYSDSPRKLSEAIHTVLPVADIVWEITEKSQEPLPTYITTVKPQSLSSLYYRSRSKVVVDNYMGWSYGYTFHNRLKYFILANQKKHNQFNICTWHGTPLKKIGLDQPENDGKDMTFYSTADLLTANSEFMLFFI